MNRLSTLIATLLSFASGAFAADSNQKARSPCRDCSLERYAMKSLLILFTFLALSFKESSALLERAYREPWAAELKAVLA